MLRLLFQSSFRIVGGLFGSVFAVLLLVFVLIDPHPLVIRFLTLVPEDHREASRRTLLRLTQQMAAWARGVIINGTISAVTTGLLFWLIGVQPVLVFGTLFGLTGAVLALPAAALFKIVIDEFYLSHQWADKDQLKRQANQIIVGENKR